MQNNDSPPVTNMPHLLRGITLETTEDLEASLKLIASSETELTVRLVMDIEHDITDYQEAVDALSEEAIVMLQLLDSEQLADISTEDYAQRARQAVALFDDQVTVWEIGNELNGSWVGATPTEINEKIQAAEEVIREAGGKTAITLNYWSNSDCYQHSWEATVPYAQAMPPELQNVDYVFLSIYETACDPRQQPSADQLAQTLLELGQVFPKAKLGIGEIGAQGIEDGFTTEPSLAEKEAIANRYYGMQPVLRELVGTRFIGGYFWWYFHRDAVKPGLMGDPASLWPCLKQELAGLA